MRDDKGIGSRLSLLSVLLLAAMAAYACAPIEGERMQERSLSVVLEEHSRAIMSLPGVVGVGEGECAGTPCIKIYVVQKTPDLLDQIPATLDGYAVLIEEAGEIRPLGR